MLARTKKLVVAAVVVAGGVLTPAAFAATPNYTTRRIPMGPRPDQYALVRTDREGRGSSPYALTGRTEVRTVRRVVQRWSGARYIGPVWVIERVAK